VFFIAKGCVPYSMCNNPLLQCDAKLDLPSQRSLVRKHIMLMMLKIMEDYVLLTLTTCVIVSITFDLWMSKTNFDTFVMVVNFVDNSKCHNMSKLAYLCT
jgi:hypothetical protein